MRAVFVDQNKTGRLTLGEAPAPEPESGQALIDVAAISLNLGETNHAQLAPSGWRPGWDLAGTVVLVGVPNPEATLELPMIEVFGRGGSLKSSWYGDCLPSRDFPLLANYYLQGQLDLDRVVSRVIKLEDTEAAFDAMERGETLRSVIRFPNG